MCNLVASTNPISTSSEFNLAVDLDTQQDTELAAAELLARPHPLVVVGTNARVSAMSCAVEPLQRER